MTQNYFKLGRTFPPTAQGTGILLLGIGGIFIYYQIFEIGSEYNPKMLISLIPIVLGLWIIFSTSRVYANKISEGILVVRFGLFPFKFSRKIRLENYDAAIVKPTRQTYRVQQGIGAGIAINDPEFTDTFIGLHFKKKGSFEEELILKGKGPEVIQFMKDNLVSTHLRLFVGLVKKGYELKLDSEN